MEKIQIKDIKKHLHTQHMQIDFKIIDAQKDELYPTVSPLEIVYKNNHHLTDLLTMFLRNAGDDYKTSFTRALKDSATKEKDSRYSGISSDDFFDNSQTMIFEKVQNDFIEYCTMLSEASNKTAEIKKKIDKHFNKKFFTETVEKIQALKKEIHDSMPDKEIVMHLKNKGISISLDPLNQVTKDVTEQHFIRDVIREYSFK